MNRRISLYVPCYNSQNYIRRCLESIFSQKYPIKEVIVVDDGSTDKTLQIAKKFPVKVIRHSQNLGLAAARNTAIKNACGDFIASVDSDCVLDSDWLRNIMQEFKSKKVGGAGGRLENSSAGNVVDGWRAAHMVQHWGDKKILPLFLSGSNTVFTKESLWKAGLYDEKYKTAYDDWDISLKVKEKGFIIKYNPKAKVYHLKNDTLSSLLNTYWIYHFHHNYDYRKGKYYGNFKGFFLKIEENIMVAKNYIVEDLRERKQNLLYIDFILPAFLILKDLKFFYDNKEFSSTMQRINSKVIKSFDFVLSEKQVHLSKVLIKNNEAFEKISFVFILLLTYFIKRNFFSLCTCEVIIRDLVTTVLGNNENSDKLICEIIEIASNEDSLVRKKYKYSNIYFLNWPISSLKRFYNSSFCKSERFIKLVEISQNKILKKSKLQ